MSEPARDERSPSEVLASWVTRQRLHPVTWVIVIATLVHLVGDIVYALESARSLIVRGAPVSPSSASWPLFFARTLHDIAYTTLFVGTAASVEFLFRIWDELRMRRLPPGETSS